MSKEKIKDILEFYFNMKDKLQIELKDIEVIDEMSSEDKIYIKIDKNTTNELIQNFLILKNENIEKLSIEYMKDNDLFDFLSIDVKIKILKILDFEKLIINKNKFIKLANNLIQDDIYEEIRKIFKAVQNNKLNEFIEENNGNLFLSSEIIDDFKSRFQSSLIFNEVSKISKKHFDIEKFIEFRYGLKPDISSLVDIKQLVEQEVLYLGNPMDVDEQLKYIETFGINKEYLYKEILKAGIIETKNIFSDYGEEINYGNGKTAFRIDI